MKVIENIKYGEHSKQVLDVYIPDAPSFPVYVFLHGGGLENGTKSIDFLLALAKKGVAVVSGDYRLYPEAKYPEFIEDGASIVKWAKDNMGSYGRVDGFFVGGNSAGAYITQMLCFDKKYLAKHKLSNADITGYYHAAGQPTTHFNVLRERGLDTRRVIVDEAAPLYHIKEENYPPMEFVISDNDLPARYEQTMLVMATLKHFGCDMDKITIDIRENSTHCDYKFIVDDDGNYVFADMIYSFIERVM